MIIAAIILALLPLPLFVLAGKRAYLRTAPMPVLALAGVYVFMFLGAGLVTTDADAYTDRFFVSLVVIAIGFYVYFGALLQSPRRVTLDWSHIQLRPPELASFLMVSALWGYAAIMFALYTSRNGLPALFLLDLGSPGLDVYQIRAEKSTNLSEGAHWYRLGLQTTPLFIFIYSLAWFRSSGTRLARTTFFVSLPLIVVSLSSFATKDGVVLLTLYAIVSGFVSGQIKVISLRFWLLGMGAIGSVFVWLRIYLLDRPVADVASLFLGYLLERTVGAYVRAHAMVMRVFPDTEPFFNGRAFANPGGILPFEPIDFSRFLGLRATGHISNYAAPSFSQGYANFGWPGIIIIIAVLILQIAFFTHVFRRLPKNILFYSLYVFIAGRMIEFGRQSVLNVVPPHTAVFLCGIVVLYYVLRAVTTRPQSTSRAGVAMYRTSRPASSVGSRSR